MENKTPGTFVKSISQPEKKNRKISRCLVLPSYFPCLRALLSSWYSKLISHIWCLECQTPNVAVLPGSSFSATSAYSDSFKASNVRFAIENPWCPATFDSDNEYVTVDLQCARSVCQVEGKDPHLLFYNGEYSNDNVNWEKLESEDETHYSPYLGVSEKYIVPRSKRKLRSLFLYINRMYTKP